VATLQAQVGPCGADLQAPALAPELEAEMQARMDADPALAPAPTAILDLRVEADEVRRECAAQAGMLQGSISLGLGNQGFQVGGGVDVDVDVGVGGGGADVNGSAGGSAGGTGASGGGTRISIGTTPLPATKVEADLLILQRDCEARIAAIYDAEYGRMEGAAFIETMGSIQLGWREGRMDGNGRYLTFMAEAESQSFLDLRCRGPLYADRLAATGYVTATFHPERSDAGASMRVKDAQGRTVMVLHDNPRCAVNLYTSADVPTITLDLADHLICATTQAGHLRCEAEGSATAMLMLGRGAHARLGQGNSLTIAGQATFLVHDVRADAQYESAVAQGRVGGEARIAVDPATGTRIAVAAPIVDLDMQVEALPRGMTATLDSEAGTGKTVSFALDSRLVSATDLRVRAWDMGAETELEVRMAASLEDVLDPADDAIEYWVVADDDSVQVLVSIHEFSTKRIDIESAEATDAPGPTQGTPMLGLPLLLIAVALAALVVRVRRLR
jgi:hypothetical protein